MTRYGIGERRVPGRVKCAAGSLNLRPARGESWKMAEDHEVLTTEAAAALLRVSTKTVLSLVRSGKLSGEKVGRAWRFPKRDVLDYVRGSSEPKAGVVDE